jgi:hypothetical protein
MTVRPKQFSSPSVKMRGPATTGLPHRERAMTEDGPSIRNGARNGPRLRVMRHHLRQRRSCIRRQAFLRVDGDLEFAGLAILVTNIHRTSSLLRDV